MPAAFAAIRGVSEYVAGKTEARRRHFRAVRSGDRDSPRGSAADLPVAPDRSAHGHRRGARLGDGPPFGTGPFQVALHTPERVVLERNPRYAGGRARRPDRVPGLARAPPRSPTAFATGELDVARDLLPQDLEAILREPRFRAGLVETPKKNTYFAVFHTGEPRGIERRLCEPRSPAPFGRRTSSGERSGASPCPPRA